MKRLQVAEFLVIALCMAAPAWAHHNAAGIDRTKTVTVEGTVKEFKWANPHSWVEIQVPEMGVTTDASAPSTEPTTDTTGEVSVPGSEPTTDASVEPTPETSGPSVESSPGTTPTSTDAA